ncbi:MAG TPA: FtsQ-type POTRA domain-containing protein [Candidatus Paceibacterota bacterium]|nr:FtsQ-type POTRA domain-containing protein [Candidatus Paceibacterota bacterium]
MAARQSSPVPVRMPAGRRFSAPRLRRGHRIRWLLLSVVGLAVGLAALSDFTGVIALHDITVSGVTRIDGGAVAARAYDGYRGMLFGRFTRIPTLANFSPARAEAAILAAFPEISGVRVHRRWPHEIEVAVTERQPVGTWCRTTEQTRPCYYFDGEGVIWGTAVPSSGTILLGVRDERPEGDIQKELLGAILDIAEMLRELDLGVRQVLVGRGPLSELRVSVTAGFDIMYSLEHDIRAQSGVLEVFLADRRAAGSFTAEYVDLRVPEKVFYK